MTKVHAIQNAEYRIYESIDSNHCIGHFIPMKKYPVSFFGNSPDDVSQKIQTFIAETVEKYGIDEKEAEKRKGKKVSRTINEEPEFDADDEFEDLLS